MPGKRKPKSRIKFWLIAAFLCVVVVFVLVYGIWAQKFDMKEVEKMTERSAVYDMDGKFYSKFRSEDRVIVPLDKVSPDFIKALLAREDSRFYHHPGVDVIGVARAIVRNIIHRRGKEGASTLTQQLARNSFPLGGHTLHRKALEAFVALRIERNYSKQQILENYVNRIYYGAGFYGVETASQAYFSKHAANLSLAESALLVGIIRGPNRFSPFTNPKGAFAQRDAVLKRMTDQKMITRAQADAALHAKIIIAKKRSSAQENYAMDAVRRDLDDILNDDQVAEGGLKIYTTIDAQLQNIATTAVDKQLRKIEARPGYDHPKKSQFTAEQREEEALTPYLQGSVVAIDNRSGAIRALVGGRDYGESKYNRALVAQRQIGSTFKPFVYAAAFGRGLTPDSMMDDSAIQPGELKGAPNWHPANSDGTYRGLLPASEGLIQSRNTLSVRVGNFAGIDEVSRVAAAAGLGKIPRGPASYLGSFEATLADLTTAYTIFPNAGIRRQSYIIERIDNADGQMIYRANHASAVTLSANACATTTAVLVQVLERGTAASAKSLGFSKPAAGKTGTTNDYHDAYFVGYTKSLTCGVWVGLDEPATIIAKGYGSALALPVWVDVMNGGSPQRYPAAEFPRLQPAERAVDLPRAIESAPSKILRSFRNFFGR